MLEASDLIGTVDVSSIQPQHREPNKKKSDPAGTKEEVKQVKDGLAAEGAQLSSASDPIVSSGGSFHPPPVSNCLNIADLESVCVRRMTKEGLDYYISAADDEITLRENRAAFLRVFLKPRVLVNVGHVDTATSMLGTRVSLPLYLTACALGKLAHPDGECALTRAAGSHGIIQMCPTLGSCSIEEMAEARSGPTSPTQWFQLYVNANRETTLSLIRRAEASGMQALCITVDAPVLGRRERDMRNKLATAPPSQLKKSGGTQKGTAGGVARSLSQFIDPSLAWSDIAWFKQNTRLPLVLKGIQTAEDAVMAVKHGAAAIVVSNHGGRQLDCCRSGIEMLIDICDSLRAQQLWGRLEVYMDGGVRRGSDIYKAVAAGARAVGIGRPALFGLGAYGQQGVERAVEILREELIMTMMLMGCPTLADVQRDSLMTNTVAQHITTVPTDFLAAGNYRPLGLTAMSKL
jgi:L-lactate dehydrogenase (cytochrome)